MQTPMHNKKIKNIPVLNGKSFLSFSTIAFAKHHIPIAKHARQISAFQKSGTWRTTVLTKVLYVSKSVAKQNITFSFSYIILQKARVVKVSSLIYHTFACHFLWLFDLHQF